MRPLGSIYTHAGKKYRCSTCQQDGEKGDFIIITRLARGEGYFSFRDHWLCWMSKAVRWDNEHPYVAKQRGNRWRETFIRPDPRPEKEAGGLANEADSSPA